MAYVKTVRVVYTKGIEAIDPFMLAGIVKPVLNRNDRQQFEQAYPSITKYAELIALCEKFVELDPTKDVGTEPKYGAKREIYNDQPVPWLALLWDTAALLLKSARVVDKWEVMTGNHDYRGQILWLKSLTMSHTNSPSVEVEGQRHGSGQMVKMRTYPGLAMNMMLEKATPEKIAAKLLEHGEKGIDKVKVRNERDAEQHNKMVKAARLVTLIEATYGVPRYYEGSRELALSTDGAQLRVTPTDDGAANLSLTIRVTANGQVEKLRQPIELIMALKQAVDAAKKEAK